MDKIPDIRASRIEQAAEFILRKTSASPEIGIMLGSGQGGFSRRLKVADYIPYHQIPNFHKPIVPGHEGVMTIGALEGHKVAVLEGRVHIYEGYFMREIVFPVRVLHRLGIRDLIICNAAGCLNDRFSSGDVMIVADHINLMGGNPLIGQIHQDGQSPFLSLVSAYDQGCRQKAGEAGREMGMELKEGILAAVSGPCFETPSESRMLSALGADAVTMSTVPEVIMARFLGMRVLALSLITNVHRDGKGMDHQRVLAVAYERTGFFMELIARIICKYNKEGHHG